MKVVLIACVIAVAAAGRLENTYLPPQGSHGAGGSGSLLSAPFGNRFGGSSSPFGKPGDGSAPSGSHGGAGGGRSKSGEAGAKILRYDSNNDGLGSYSYQYETENRIQAQEEGQLKNAGSDAESMSAQGSYSYTGPDGAVYTITYVADENGFQASGAHLPTAPPIPDEILKSLEQNAAEEAAGIHAGGASSGQYQAPGQQSFSPQSGYKY